MTRIIELPDASSKRIIYGLDGYICEVIEEERCVKHEKKKKLLVVPEG